MSKRLEMVKICHKNFMDLGLNYMEVIYLLEFITRNKIGLKKDFYKICECKILDEHRDKYSISMQERYRGKLSDLYHDINFKNRLTRMFLRTIVGLTNFPTIDFSHWQAIRYEKSLKVNNDNEYIKPYYNKVMSRFWADKVLAGPIIKKISKRLRRKENVGYRPIIIDNLKNVQFAKEKILERFFYGNTSLISFAVETQSKFRFEIEETINKMIEEQIITRK